MQHNKNHNFIKPDDEITRLINDKAKLLYQKLLLLDINDVEIDDYGKNYFKKHHGGRRLIFSIESSAHIINNAVKLQQKKISDTSFMDYGAGLGTLFLLAGMIGFKKVYFNDYFPEWAEYAKKICAKLDIVVDDFIPGDIEAVMQYGKQHNLRFDIVASRNVIEHIYDLRNFYTTICQSGSTDICYATTTANYHNLPMRLKHYWHHHKLEKILYKKQREDYVKELKPGINNDDLQRLVKLTRGKAFTDFTDSVKLYFDRQPIPPVEFLRTNTCDCKTGVWAENLITRKNYFTIIQDAGMKAQYSAGFWDTHYKYKLVNLVAGLLNRIIKMTGKKGYWFAPFVNVTATKN